MRQFYLRLNIIQGILYHPMKQLQLMKVRTEKGKRFKFGQIIRY